MTPEQLEQLYEAAGLDEQPKTYGCHHNMPVCSLCEDMVSRWLLKREAVAFYASDPVAAAHDLKIRQNR